MFLSRYRLLFEQVYFLGVTEIFFYYSHLLLVRPQTDAFTSDASLFAAPFADLRIRAQETSPISSSDRSRLRIRSSDRVSRLERRPCRRWPINLSIASSNDMALAFDCLDRHDKSPFGIQIAGCIRQRPVKSSLSRFSSRTVHEQLRPVGCTRSATRHGQSMANEARQATLIGGCLCFSSCVFQSAVKNETPTAVWVFPSFSFFFYCYGFEQKVHRDSLSGEMHTSNLVTIDRDIAFQDGHSSAKIPSCLEFSSVPFFGDGGGGGGV